jgi:hypothetical protein
MAPHRRTALRLGRARRVDPGRVCRPRARPGPGCDAPESRQFDFWVGDWEVFTADGAMAGTNRVEKILGRCVIQENWSGSKGTDGRSFNLYSAADKKWHQTWVDSEGTLLELTGGLVDGRMVLEGDSPSGNGASIRNRITWQKLPDGNVRQHWQLSTSGGEAWTDAFVGIYKPKAKPKPTGKP